MIQFDRLEPLSNDCLDIWNIKEIDNQAIAQESLKYISQVKDSNSINTMSEDSIINPEAPSTKKLLDKINEVLKYRNLTQAGEPWGQIHRLYEATGMHDHIEHDVAWVYYVRVPEDSGLLVCTLFEGWSRRREYAHKPEEGQLIMFPGWMVHRVTKNFNEIPRISIAGDANYIKESK